MRRWLLKLLRVEERPAPPPGSEGTLSVFHPSRRFLYYNVLGWAGKQLAGFFGIVVPLVALGGWHNRWVSTAVGSLDRASEPLPFDLGSLLMGLMVSVEAFALVAFLTQLVVTGLMLELGWRMRWYMVSDESLRIREGLVRVREQTLRVANIQNIVVRQGPLQRLFGIADLEVHTAGGGQGKGGSDGESSKEKRGHVGRFRGLDDAAGLRDRLQRSLSRHRGAGLGEAGEKRPAGGRRRSADPDLDDAARELLAEARSLRSALESAAGTSA
ncbi:MAG: PH domain-containing protein [Thermoanaerobaculia bacterium]|nr:PH domain-containing protein [Thermoanaerobaculia bacterium]